MAKNDFLIFILAILLAFYYQYYQHRPKDIFIYDKTYNVTNCTFAEQLSNLVKNINTIYFKFEQLDEQHKRRIFSEFPNEVDNVLQSWIQIIKNLNNSVIPRFEKVYNTINQSIVYLYTFHYLINEHITPENVMEYINNTWITYNKYIFEDEKQIDKLFDTVTQFKQIFLSYDEKKIRKILYKVMPI